MRSLLEKTIVHLLNGDEEKAAALFHKFMVEKARQIHESLRQDEEIDLGEGWDTEMKEEEYFDDGDLAAEDEPLAGDDASGDSMEDVEDMNAVGDDGTEDSQDVGDPDDAEMDDMGDGMDDGGTVDDKLDNIESKIEELTAEFDRLMGKFEDEGAVDDLGDDEMGDDLGSDDSLPSDDFEDVEGEEPSMDAGDTDDLADRFDSDLSDEDKPESETMESVEMDDELDEDLADITESVLSELDRITLPSNGEGKEIGSGGKTKAPATNSMLPNHNVNDRISQAKPYLVKGGNNDSMEREASPPTKPVSTMVDGVRKGNVRDHWSDTMKEVGPKGDNAALINKDYAGKEPSPGSIIDGKTKPKTS